MAPVLFISTGIKMPFSYITFETLLPALQKNSTSLMVVKASFQNNRIAYVGQS
jgi:hypothetical protein